MVIARNERGQPAVELGVHSIALVNLTEGT